jgi:alginate O-acetyltransferase complex protein AlgI
VYLLLVVVIGWVFFRAETLAGALAMLRAMAGLGVAAPTPFALGWYLTPELVLALAAGAIGSTPWLRVFTRERQESWTLGLATTAALVAMLAASMMQIAARAYNPFIYFRF